MDENIIGYLMCMIGDVFFDFFFAKVYGRTIGSDPAMFVSIFLIHCNGTRRIQEKKNSRWKRADMSMNSIIAQDSWLLIRFLSLETNKIAKV